MRVAGINWGILLGIQGLYGTKPRGITLIESTQIRRWSGGGGCSLLSEAKSLKTSSQDRQARIHSHQMVRMMARQEAGMHKWRWTQGLHFRELRLWTIQDAQWGLENYYSNQRT